MNILDISRGMQSYFTSMVHLIYYNKCVKMWIVDTGTLNPLVYRLLV